MIVLVAAVFVTVTAGAYLALSKDVFRCVVGLSLLGAATNLLLFAAGRMGSSNPAVVPNDGQQVLTNAADPLPQALVLTAIVIGFAVVCLALVLLMRVMRKAGTDDALELRYAEPHHDSSSPKPPHAPEGCDPVWPPRKKGATAATGGTS